MRSERIASAVGLVAQNGAPAGNRNRLCRLRGGCITSMLQGQKGDRFDGPNIRPLFTTRPLCPLEPKQAKN